MLESRSAAPRLAGVVATLLITPAAAQSPDAAGAPPSGPAEAEPIEEIEVRGRRMSEIEFDLRMYVRRFVEEITAPPMGRGYARWQGSVCIGVHNLERSAAQYLVDRISRLAAEVGLEPGEPGCAPQVIVVFTTDANATAAAMVESEPRLFRPVGGLVGMNGSLEDLERFKQSDRPVRWWHVSMPVDARTGMPALNLTGGPPAFANSTVPFGGAPVIAVAGPSKIHSGIRDDLRQVLIIVDATKLPGTTWEQLGDYLAVVSLAQIDPEAEPAEFDSILNLFTNPAAYSGLTDWDRTYLHALYAFDQERIPSLQANDLITRMLKREREPGE